MGWYISIVYLNYDGRVLKLQTTKFDDSNTKSGVGRFLYIYFYRKFQIHPYHLNAEVLLQFS